MPVSREKSFVFDVDGVLARFTTGACSVHGRPTDETPVWTSWNHQRSWGIEDVEFYRPMSADFWRDLPVWEDGMQLLKLVVARYGTDRVSFLSAPVRTPGCEEGKRQWFGTHITPLGFDPWADLFLGGAKWKHAHQDAILLDDSETNCEKWTAAGGDAILIPRPWNTARYLCDPEGRFHVGNEQDSLEALT